MGLTNATDRATSGGLSRAIKLFRRETASVFPQLKQRCLTQSGPRTCLTAAWPWSWLTREKRPSMLLFTCRSWASPQPPNTLHVTFGDALMRAPLLDNTPSPFLVMVLI